MCIRSSVRRINRRAKSHFPSSFSSREPSCLGAHSSRSMTRSLRDFSKGLLVHSSRRMLGKRVTCVCRRNMPGARAESHIPVPAASLQTISSRWLRDRDMVSLCCAVFTALEESILADDSLERPCEVLKPFAVSWAHFAV